MAKTKRVLIIGTFIVSCVATVISIVSMATEEWVTSSLKGQIVGLNQADVYYGLFGGTFIQYYLGSNKIRNKIAIACIFEENICGFSTATQSSERTMELKNIRNAISCYKDDSTVKLYSNYLSTKSPKLLVVSNEIIGETINIENTETDNSIEIEFLDKFNKTDSMRYRRIERNIEKINKDTEYNGDSTTITSSTTLDLDDSMGKCDPTFLNAGLWLMTTFFLSLSIMMGALTATISVANTAGNPISPWFNIWGLYIWNSLASFFIAVTIILWGSQFGAIVVNNVSVNVTLNGKYKNGSTAMGFSFWMLFAPLVLHIVNIGLFKYRQYLIEREPDISEEKIDNADRDGMIFVY